VLPIFFGQNFLGTYGDALTNIIVSLSLTAISSGILYFLNLHIHPVYSCLERKMSDIGSEYEVPLDNGKTYELEDI